MNRTISLKSLAVAGLALGAMAAASVAHARSDVLFSIGVQAPGFYFQASPAYVEPWPVYVQPRPVYTQPRPVYYPAQPVYTPAPVYYGQGWEQRRGYNNHYNQRHQGRRAGPNGDLDRDGIPNRADRDRDGDGVYNRYDRAPNNRYYR